MDFPFYGGSAASPVTWATRPVAPNVGQRIRCTDLNNKEFYWNGTVWLPMGSAVIAQSGIASSVTGTTVETTLANITIPGGMLGPNGVIRVSTLWSTTNNANNKFLRVSFGGTYYSSFIGTTSSSVQTQANIRNWNSTASQVGLGAGNSGFGGVTTAAATSTADTLLDQTLAIRAQLATATDTATLLAYTVEVLPA